VGFFPLLPCKGNLNLQVIRMPLKISRVISFEEKKFLSYSIAVLPLGIFKGFKYCFLDYTMLCYK